MKIKYQQYELKTSKRGVKCYVCGRTVPVGENYYKNIKFLGFLSSPANVCLNCWSSNENQSKSANKKLTNYLKSK